MSARTGAQFLHCVRKHPRDLWHRRELVKDPTTHPAFRNGLQSLAALYDLQGHRPAEMLYESPTSGEAVGLSFMIPRTEFFLGLASLIVDTIGIESFPHVQEKVADVWVYLETMKGLLRAAEADAQPDAYGAVRPAWPPLDAARHLYLRWYPRMTETAIIG